MIAVLAIVQDTWPSEGGSYQFDTPPDAFTLLERTDSRNPE